MGILKVHPLSQAWRMPKGLQLLRWYWGELVDKNNPNKNNPKIWWTYLFKNKNKHPRNWLLLVVLEFCMQHTSNPKPQSLQFGRPMWRRPKPTTPLCARFTACNAAWSCDFTGGTGGPQRAWATGVRVGVFGLCLGRLGGVLGRFGPFLAASRYRSIQLFLGRFCLPLAVSSDKISHKRPSK